MNPRSLIRNCLELEVSNAASASARTSRLCVLLIGVTCFLGAVGTTTAQVFPVDPVGFANLPLSLGQSLISNPYDAADNSLNGVFDPLSVPSGTMLAKWDSTNGQYLPASVFASGSWSINYQLPPGEGALLTAPVAFMNLFIGVVLTLENPSPPANGAAGTYLLSSKAPLQLGPGHLPVFESVIGRGPRDGEQFRWLDPTTQLFHTTTFAAGAWNNGAPALNVGQSAFFILLPEPSTIVGLLLAVLLAVGTRSHRLRK
jgi:hypothetical protein